MTSRNKQSGQQDAHHQHMARALELAQRGTWSTHPNPAVGCVIVKGGQVVGEGYHIRAGENHAEANALADAGDDARGATVYVTLEPCSFEGRTPACAGRLIEAGVERAHVAMLDPDPRNAGAGVKMLEDAGIKVEVGLLADAAAALNPGHVKRHREGMPWVRLKLAMTMDGKTALASGESKWITSEASRLDVQQLRARSSALVTGVQTVIDDNPSLRFRADGLHHPHLDAALAAPRNIYVLDSTGRVPPDAAIMQQPETLLVTGPDATLPANKTGRAKNLHTEIKNGRISLQPFLALLAEREQGEVLFECGATLAGALIAENLVDELVLYIAPTFMGSGANTSLERTSLNKPLLNLPEIDKMADLVRFDIADLRQVGEDVRVTLRPPTG